MAIFYDPTSPHTIHGDCSYPYSSLRIRYFHLHRESFSRLPLRLLIYIFHVLRLVRLMPLVLLHKLHQDCSDECECWQYGETILNQGASMFYHHWLIYRYHPHMMSSLHVEHVLPFPHKLHLDQILKQLQHLLILY